MLQFHLEFEQITLKNSDYIREEMRQLDPGSFVKRGPRHMKIRRLERLAREAHQEASSSSPQPAPPPPARFIVYNGENRLVPSAPQVEDNDTEGSSEDENDPDQYHDQCFYDAPLSDVVPEENGELHSISTRPPHDISAAATILRDTLPSLHALSQLLNNVDTSNVVLDQSTYGLFLQGMGSAALLERQLSRMISRTGS